MALIQVYQKDSKVLSLNFTQDDGVTPLNISGYVIYFAASQSYNAGPIILLSTTGFGPTSVTGLATITLGTGDTNQCPGNYSADFKLISPSGAASTFATDGLSILPSVFPF